ncbi:unnamed protein product [Penicillium bialowiezense]
MGFGFWGPSKGPARAQSDLANKVQDPRTPLAYEIRHKQASVPEAGKRTPYSHELIQRADVEKHLRNAPPPVQDPGSKSAPQILGLGPRQKGQRDMTRPKEFKNHDRVIPRTGHYTEYPTEDYPYDNQTARRGAFKPVKTAKGNTRMEHVNPGYVRTITDQNKQIQTVLYHPEHLATHGPSPQARGNNNGALYPSQEVFRAQTFGSRQNSGLPASKS